MFLKSLIIKTPIRVIREIHFHKGLNLIIDQTPSNSNVTNTDTGNNVGKTTVLKLIDFCLGKEPEVIYKDPENKREVYGLVKDFLIKEKVEIILSLVDDIENPMTEITIRRNFLNRKERVYEINGKILPSKKIDYEPLLMQFIFPNVKIDKPTFRQIISHNIRYDELRLTNTLKTLDGYTTDEAYESLYLYLFGCNEDGRRKLELSESIKNEEKFKKRLEKQETIGGYKSALEAIEMDIDKLNKQKATLNINPDLEIDLRMLNDIKSEINRLSSDITSLSIRRDIILDTEKDFSSQQFKSDTSQLELVYRQAAAFIPNLQKSFEDLVSYHNQMLEEKTKFIVQELPMLNKRIDDKNNELNRLREQEQIYASKVTCSDTFEDLESIITDLNILHQKKGSYESIVAQIEGVDASLSKFRLELRDINDALFSNDFQKKVASQLSKFNKIFSDISEVLYNERYAIKYDPIITAKGKKIYKFATIDTNFSSGKKQGEISCFDIAYTKFADQEGIPCLHFLLNDKKELVHDNQLIKLAEVVEKNSIQYIASILEDKLPEQLKNEHNYILKLSQKDKLFKIEN
ncbi:MAG: DUF2326 domain-containing protein [Mediterranea sp.]|jgi:uncharacterized protein YydD (DUF2326 family)|nr:DUF2326 domain-containing protein [Mediterranea sp.]